MQYNQQSFVSNFEAPEGIISYPEAKFIKGYKVMRKPTFLNILLFMYLKYFLFFILLAFMEHRFREIVANNSKNSRELFLNTSYYLLYGVVFTSIMSIIFSLGIYSAFQIRKGVVFIVLVISIFIAEYFLYTKISSEANWINGIFNEILSIVFFLFFFHKIIKSKS